ncbi:hypothetical protein I6I10_06975 [Corynebacterium glucuronolyticum]|uniref:Uncharacterized protein n=1 Tax=Corynebacterium glucuronolyticum TaxID=39791 RepID=A0A7T4EHQ2_9CORY|nr:hypothetical protein [Corynebacterium glucuronolyticum]QQB47601.1 hypothetical protein I6I10_06975 [Corynebacterium glucuronolyticum]
MPRFAPRIGTRPGMTWWARQWELVEMRSTAKVAQVENAIRKPIEQAARSIDPNGAPDEVVALVSSDLRLPVKGRRGKPAAYWTGVFQ